MNKISCENSVAIRGVGLITPVAVSLGDVPEIDEHRKAIPKQTPVVPPPEGMTSRDQRRLAHLTKLALYAADQALRNADLGGRDAGLYVGLTHGTASYLKEFHDYLFDYGPEMASPNAFSNGVTNAPLGAVSLHGRLTEGGVTMLGIENCGLDVLEQAARKLHDGTHEVCLAGTTEEYSPIVESVYRRLGWYGGEEPPWLPHPYQNGSAIGFGISEGSAFCALTSIENTSAKGTPRGVAYTPVPDPLQLDTPPDLIISGAGGGPQDGAELELISRLLVHMEPKPAVIFPKSVFGETFAVAPMLAVTAGWDTLTVCRRYPTYPLHPSIADLAITAYNPGDVHRVLIVAASRDGAVSAGLMTAEARRHCGS